MRDGFLSERDFPNLMTAAAKLAETGIHIDDEAIRAAAFDFNAGFLDRMAVAVDDYLAVGGLTAAGPSPSPLREIVENHALLVEIIVGANACTTASDRTRASVIKGLSVRLEALGEFCQEFTGMSVEALAAEPKLLELTYEEWLELKRQHARMRERLRVTIGILRETTENAGPGPHEPEAAFRLRETWGVATMSPRKRAACLRVHAGNARGAQ